jgi:hypothetical protein
MFLTTLLRTLAGVAGAKLLPTGEAVFNLREHHIYNLQEREGRMDGI